MIFCKNQWVNSEGKRNIVKFWIWVNISISKLFASQTWVPATKPTKNWTWWHVPIILSLGKCKLAEPGVACCSATGPHESSQNKMGTTWRKDIQDWHLAPTWTCIRVCTEGGWRERRRREKETYRERRCEIVQCRNLTQPRRRSEA